MTRRRFGTGCRRGVLWAPAAGAVLLLAACAAPTPSGTPTASPEEPPAPTSAAPAALPDDVWSAVLADLATRTDGAPTVVTAKAVTWRDGSLDCPEPGMSYTQALVDGYHVVVEVAGERYDYRTGPTGAVRLCTTPSR